MKQLRISIFGFLFLLVFNIFAQQGNVAGGGEAYGSGGTLSYSIGQTDYLAYSSAAGNISLGMQQTWLDNYVIPPINQVQNIILGMDDTDCFDATETVVLAGNDTYFIVGNGGYAEIIAGVNILFMEGSSVEPGGTLHAWITQDDNYCGMYTSMMAAKDEEAPDKITAIHPKGDACCRVYPNPTTGKFTLSLSGFGERNNIIIEIYSMQGYLINRIEWPLQNKYNLSLAGVQPGLYLMRIMAGNETCISKVLKE
jgi:hypothetical protein